MPYSCYEECQRERERERERERAIEKQNDIIYMNVSLITEKQLIQ